MRLALALLTAGLLLAGVVAGGNPPAASGPLAALLAATLLEGLAVNLGTAWFSPTLACGLSLAALPEVGLRWGLAAVLLAVTLRTLTRGGDPLPDLLGAAAGAWLARYPYLAFLAVWPLGVVLPERLAPSGSVTRRCRQELRWEAFALGCQGPLAVLLWGYRPWLVLLLLPLTVGLARVARLTLARQLRPDRDEETRREFAAKGAGLRREAERQQSRERLLEARARAFTALERLADEPSVPALLGALAEHVPAARVLYFEAPRDGLPAAAQQAFGSGQRVRLAQELAYPLTTGVIWVEAPQPLSQETDLFLHYGVLALERRQQLLDLNQASKLAAVGQLAAGLAHELNTPLGAALLAVEAVAADPERAPVLLPSAQKALQSMQRILERMLSGARAAGQRGRHDLADLARTTVTLLGPGLAPAEVALELEPAPATVAPAELEQVLLNLLTNARDAGSRRIVVRTRGTSVAVEDDGSGIEPAVAERMFEPFFTTRPVGQGTGLGLAVSRDLVQAQGGRLTWRPRPGGGSIFLVELPA